MKTYKLLLTIIVALSSHFALTDFEVETSSGTVDGYKKKRVIYLIKPKSHNKTLRSTGEFNSPLNSLLKIDDDNKKRYTGREPKTYGN